jgi:mRNA-degrading endonuclease RelE of RelBE toxin-antitoxin system
MAGYNLTANITFFLSVSFEQTFLFKRKVWLRQLEDLPADIAKDILDKIEWLRTNAEALRHERLSGGPEFSLHSGQYRVLYLLDRRRRQIEILDVDKHNAAYRRLRRRR